MDNHMEDNTTTPTTPSPDLSTIVRQALLATKRPKTQKLLDKMQEIGYFSAPASGGNHSFADGGLLVHSVNVLYNALAIAKALLTEEEYTAMHDSIVVCALLHDLGKCGDYGKMLYVPNILKSGKRSTTKPNMRNKDLTPIPHSVRSIKLVAASAGASYLSEEEEWAILCHDGMYDSAKLYLPGHETRLYLILHTADMWASRFTERDGEDGDEEDN